jgi:hypothetical protein
MVQMARLGIALQPIATALFANSPFRDGKPTGYLSWRSHVWTDTVSISAWDSEPSARAVLLLCLCREACGSLVKSWSCAASTAQGSQTTF